MSEKTPVELVPANNMATQLTALGITPANGSDKFADNVYVEDLRADNAFESRETELNEMKTLSDNFTMFCESVYPQGREYVQNFMSMVFSLSPSQVKIGTAAGGKWDGAVDVYNVQTTADGLQRAHLLGKETYKDGELLESKAFYQTGEVLKEMHPSGARRSGAWFYANQNKAVEFDDNGNRLTYYPNGKVWMYAGAEKDGKSKIALYTPEGETLLEQSMERKIFNRADGSTWFESDFADGKFIGATRFDRDGRVIGLYNESKHLITTENSQLQKEISLTENGCLHTEITIQAGVPHKHEVFDEQGNVSETFINENTLTGQLSKNQQYENADLAVSLKDFGKGVVPATQEEPVSLNTAHKNVSY